MDVTEGSGARILLVDDDCDVRSVTAALLVEIGYEVVEAGSGDAALDCLERERDRIELMIADVARKAAESGWRELIVTMGAISVVLGLMNLIPVPVLDGFHVLTALIEGIRRKPLSVRFREVANVVGIALLLTLMLYAFRNDAMRKWFE